MKKVKAKLSETRKRLGRTNWAKVKNDGSSGKAPSLSSNTQRNNKN